MISLEGLNLGRSLMPNGPKWVELLSPEAGLRLLVMAKGSIFSREVKIGISLLTGEPHRQLMPLFEGEGCDYFELNTKYEARELKDLRHADPDAYVRRAFDKVRQEIETALKASNVPLLVKLARDLPWLTVEGFLGQLASEFRSSRVGFILANTKQYPMPPDPQDPRHSNIPGIKRGFFLAPICGEYLFPETLDLIWRARPMAHDTPLIASGGAIDLYHIVALLANGAKAVQICTALCFYPYSRRYVMLREDLRNYLERANEEDRRR
jgi:dihydroorotate dehydrogenase